MVDVGESWDEEGNCNLTSTEQIKEEEKVQR